MRIIQKLLTVGQRRQHFMPIFTIKVASREVQFQPSSVKVLFRGLITLTVGNNVLFPLMPEIILSEQVSFLQMEYISLWNGNTSIHLLNRRVHRREGDKIYRRGQASGLCFSRGDGSKTASENHRLLWKRASEVRLLGRIAAGVWVVLFKTMGGGK